MSLATAAHRRAPQRMQDFSVRCGGNSSSENRRSKCEQEIVNAI
jgi:hypothetical protein